MHEAFNLLDNQPAGFPQWSLARDAFGQLQYIKHLFIVDHAEFRSSLSIVPACRFVDGAEWVERASPIERGFASDGDPLCLDCMEVSLQHGLARMC